MGKKLYVGNLSYDVDSSALSDLFTAHGTVTSSQIITDRDTGQSKGFGFVEMGSDSEAQAAIAALNAPKPFLQIGPDFFNRSDIVRVEIKVKAKDKGQFVIGFDSNDDFERILEALKK